jgi:Sulfotransferase family
VSTSLRPPIFILGNPRSGTTLLRLMLTCHREIVIPPECGFAVWLYDKYRDWDAARAPALIGPFAGEVAAARKFDTWGLDRHRLAAALAAAPPASYAEAASRVYECYASHRGRSFGRWGDKNNFYVDHVATIDAIYPRAFFVHIVRDGRNVACSYKGLHAAALESRYAPRLPWKAAEVAAEWQDANAKIDAGLGELAAERVFRLRFEDLVTDTESRLRSLCDALGEDFDPAMLDYHRQNARQELEPAELLAWKQKTLQPPIRSEVDRFRRELEADEIAAFEHVAGATLARYGYESSHD